MDAGRWAGINRHQIFVTCKTSTFEHISDTVFLVAIQNLSSIKRSVYRADMDSQSIAWFPRNFRRRLRKRLCVGQVEPRMLCARALPVA
ncbi:hypothetical protein CJO71_06930 [Burkholderia ubonensis]|uniref:Transposase DDE domain-containing protein n=1 Tax=Burkholderia ubonensis TaxID=101571 RepID=A0AB74D8R7_9BURK|nr:hypothetical protein CJO71_06930 [Burkholderia ubonensis]PAJ99254.1 hypothetical protein CJO68_21700 [Burkholderia ubonensis]RQP75167.1 hypothetical protein DF015_21340 [Burkholderia ubonensis]RQP92326.1 hypothetical protein DF012_20815 [Burkholderia ubonensis]